MPKYVVLFEHPDHPERTRFLSTDRYTAQDWLVDDISDAQRFDTPAAARETGMQLAGVSLDMIDHPLWRVKFRLICQQVMPYGQHGSYMFNAALIRDFTMKVCEMFDREPVRPNYDPECHEPTWDVVRPAVTTDLMTYQGVSTT